MDSAPQLRPLSIGDLFDAAFRLYRGRFWTFSAIATLVLVPSTLLQSFLWSTLLGGGFFGSFSPFSLYSGSFLTGWLWSLTLGNLLHGALVNASAQAYMGHPVAPIAAYRFGLRRYIALVLASIIPLIATSLAQLIPNLLGIIPYYLLYGLFVTGPVVGFQSLVRDLPLVLACLAGLLAIELALLALSAYFLLVPQAVVLEQRSPIVAIRRSASLVRGSIRRALGIVIATGILSFLISTVPSSIVPLFFRLSGANTALFSLLFTILGLAGQILLQPIQFAIFTLFYYDQRVRKEGYDIEIRAQQSALP